MAQSPRRARESFLEAPQHLLREGPLERPAESSSGKAEQSVGCVCAWVRPRDPREFEESPDKRFCTPHKLHQERGPSVSTACPRRCARTARAPRESLLGALKQPTRAPGARSPPARSPHVRTPRSRGSPGNDAKSKGRDPAPMWAPKPRIWANVPRARVIPRGSLNPGGVRGRPESASSRNVPCRRRRCSCLSGPFWSWGISGASLDSLGIYGPFPRLSGYLWASLGLSGPL